MTPRCQLHSLSVGAYAQGVTQWFYRAPQGHHPGLLADSAYWHDIATPGQRGHVQPGDWLFTTQALPDGRLINSISAFVAGPLGTWAQQLVSSIPTVGVTTSHPLG